jgi:hypothetical protein
MKPKKILKALQIVSELVARMSPEDREEFLLHFFPDLHSLRNSADNNNGHEEDGDRARHRILLVKALGMLGSVYAGERASAALVVERSRAKLGKSWEDLIVVL